MDIRGYLNTFERSLNEIVGRVSKRKKFITDLYGSDCQTEFAIRDREFELRIDVTEPAVVRYMLPDASI